MTRRLAALIAAIALLVTAVTPSIAQVSQTAPAAASDRVAAAPASPVDESKVPHYFGPYPNWANSPLTLPDATGDDHSGGFASDPDGDGRQRAD